jgi:hypothetical protein
MDSPESHLRLAAFRCYVCVTDNGGGGAEGAATPVAADLPADLGTLSPMA